MASTTDLLTVGQAARAIGISSERVRQLVRAGRMPATVTPYGSLFTPEVVKRIAEERAARARLIVGRPEVQL